MKSLSRSYRSIAALIGYHKAQNILSRNKLDGNAASENPDVEIDPAPVILIDVFNPSVLLAQSEAQRQIIVAEHHDDIVPEIFF